MCNFWENKRVFITGINGFVGSYLCQHLLKKGATVFGLVRNRNKNTYLYFENLDEKCTLFFGDLTNKELISRIISEEAINIVYHLAAQVEVGVAITNPFLTFDTNVKGTYVLLEACRQYPETIEGIVVASSDKSYGSYPVNEMPYKEDYPLKPEFPYDTSKACADLIARSYASKIFSLPVVVTRFCNIYGPGQLNFSALIPDAVRSALGFSSFIPRSDGSLSRDFLFVRDVVELYQTIAEKLTVKKDFAGEIFNAGPNDPLSVKEVLEKIFSKMGKYTDFEKIQAVMKDKRVSGEIDYQCMDFEKVNEFFGWQPKVDFDTGISETIEWFKKYLPKQNFRKS